MKIDKIKKSIRNIPDFPKPGIQFKDITTLLKDKDAFYQSVESFYDIFKDKKIDLILGIESRGFIFGAPLAIKMGCGFILARKPGKLPSKTISEDYDLEYGKNSIEIHIDSINKNDNVLIVDDLLATGGTAQAVGKIVKQLGGKIVSYCFLIELVDLNGRKKIEDDPVISIIKY